MTGYFRSDSWFDTIMMPDLHSENNNGFVSKYSSAGQAQWVEPMGYGPYGIDTDSSGNAYVTGYHYGMYGYDSLLVSGIANSHHYLAKFDGVGNIDWILTPNDPTWGSAW